MALWSDHQIKVARDSVSYAVGILGIGYLTFNGGEPVFMAPIFLGMIGLPSILGRDEKRAAPSFPEPPPLPTPSPTPPANPTPVSVEVKSDAA